MPVVHKVKVPNKSTRGIVSARGVMSAWPDDEGIRLNLYGRSGTGKTTLWSTFPKPILAFVCSGGAKSGELRSIDTVENRKVITPIIVRETMDIAKVLRNEVYQYKTVVVEHVSGLQDLCLKEVLGLEKIPVQKTWGIAGKREWGQVGIQVKEILSEILSLPAHIVLVAQEREFNADDENEMILPFVASATSPTVMGFMNAACDYICQTFIRQRMVEKTVKIGKKTVKKFSPGKGVEYCLRVAPHQVYTTKFRIPKGQPLPEEIVDPSFAKIQGLIRGDTGQHESDRKTRR